MLVLDNRERELITLLTTIQLDHTVKQLLVGDVIIGDDTKGLIIERKSIKDLEASILDGRYREQRGRILAYCKEHNSQPMYILEGSLSSLTGRLQKKAIMKFINRLIFHYQIPVMQTESTKETAELIQALKEQWDEDPKNLERTTELVKITDGIHIQKKTNANDPRQFAISSLSQCPGISVKIAEAIFDTYGSLQSIINATSEEIANIKVGTRRVGPVVSKRLKEVLGYTT